MGLPSAAELVARYLKANGYNETVRKFIQEANLPPDVGTDATDAITIEQILQEKRTFDLSLSFEKAGIEDGRGWREPAPGMPAVVDTIPTRSNILSVHVLDIVRPGSHESQTYIAATNAARQLNLFDPRSPSLALVQSFSGVQDSPILDVIAVSKQQLLIAGMSGQLLMFDTVTSQVLHQRRDHSKYLVKIASFSVAGMTIVATAGWDSTIHLYQIGTHADEELNLGEPFSSMRLPTIPESILFLASSEHTLPLLMLTRRDSTFLFYYQIRVPSQGQPGISLVGKQNLAPHSNSWIAFSPSDVQLCPTDSTRVAIATSTTPHLKLLIVRLLLPPTPLVVDTAARSSTGAENEVTERSEAAQSVQALHARAELSRQDREEAAILVNVNTMSPQTAYSTPRLAWRPDGSGLYVSSDDGKIRGFEASTGKLMANLDAHEPLSKIRCLWAGHLGPDQSDEALISGGFDQKASRMAPALRSRLRLPPYDMMLAVLA